MATTKWTGGDVTNGYTFSVTGNLLPTDAEADGAYCYACNTGGCHAGDPINVATGNLFEHYVDYTTIGANPLSFERYYNSLSYAHGVRRRRWA